MPTFDEYIERLSQAIAIRLGMPPGVAKLPVDAQVTAPIAVAAAAPLPVVTTAPLPATIVEPVALAPATAIAVRKHTVGDPGECCDPSTETTLRSLLACHERSATEATLAAVLDHLLGVATNATLSDLLNRIPTDLDPATQATLADLLATVRTVVSEERVAVEVANLPDVQPVSVEALPLPAGAASEASLAAVLEALLYLAHPWHLTHLTTAGVHQVKASPGVLRSVVCNGKAGTRATVYNGLDTSGEVLAIITANGWSALPYEGECSAGITLELVGTWDLTVAWR